jgi:AcrR family transcriptional regulator
MPRYKESERQQAQSETRQLLVQAAIQEFARQGYERANINHISRAAGFAKGTIYNYFSRPASSSFASTWPRPGSC